MTAREEFAEARRASARIAECQRIIEEYADFVPSSKGDGVGVSTSESDPVYAAVVERRQVLARATADMDAALLIVGDALMLVEGLRKVYCRKADVLELYYIDRMTVRGVASEMGVAPSTVVAWRDELLDFLDSSPRAYILGLRYVEKPQDVVS